MHGAGVPARAASGLRRHGPALLVLLCVAVAPFLGPLLRGETPFFLDLSDHWYPFRWHAWQARQEGEIAHWCGRAFCGFPFLAQLEAGLCYPPHWVLDLFHPAKTLLAQIVGHRFVFGALVYAVLTARGASRTGAVLGGSLVIASGLTMSCFSQPAVLRTIAWIPLVFLGVFRIAQSRRLEGMLWTALGVGLVLVAGYPPFFQRAAIALPFLLVGDPSWPRGAAEWRERGVRCAWAAGGAALGVAMAAAQLLPSMALTAVSQRQLGLDPALLDGLRAEPLDLLMMLVPRFDRDCGVVKQGFAYLGMLPVALAAVAVVRRRPGAAAFALVAGAALVASMGRAVPVVGAALASLPLASSFRNPSQYLLAWVLSVPVLASMGLDALTERRATRRELAATFGAVLVLAVVASLVPSPLADRASLLRAATGVGALVAGAAVVATGIRLAPLVLAGLALADAASFQFNYPTKNGRTRKVEDAMRPDEPFALVARRHREMGREGRPRAITSDAVFNWENHGFAASVDNVRGVVSLLPMHALDLNRIVEKGAPFERRPPDEPLYSYGPTRSLGSPRIDLLAIGYAIGWNEQPGPGWSRIGPGVWERDGVPEARLVTRVLPAWSDADAARALVDPRFDPRSDVVLSMEPGEDRWPGDDRATSPGALHLAEIRTNAVTMEIDANRSATLVWSETFDAGWTCEDHPSGRALEIRRANCAHMSVAVPAGRTTLVWRYESPGWRAGLRVSIAALVALGALTILAWRRRRAAG